MFIGIHFFNNYFRDIFQSISSIHVLDNLDGDVNIDLDIHECVIFEKSCYQNNEESVYDDIEFFYGKLYELRLITCVIQLPAEMKYYAHIYSRHGGCHKNGGIKREIRLSQFLSKLNIHQY